MEKYLDILVDERNKELWDSLKERYKITLHISDEKNYKSRMIENNFEIYIYLGDLCPESFTHELLHLYSKSTGFDVHRDFVAQIYLDNIAPTIFSLDLLTHVTNVLEHQQMLKKYLELKYDNNKFISDFYEHKMTKDELAHLQKNYKRGNNYYIEAIDFYIGRFLAIKSDNNKDHNYFEALSTMKKLDKKLFTILSEFWSDWETFDIENPDDDYNEIFEMFVEDLNSWAVTRNLIRIQA